MIDSCDDTTAATLDADQADEKRRPVRSRAEALAMFEGNVGLVGDVVKRLGLLGRPDADDLMQLGRMGLWHAAQRFDESRGYQFSTYASSIIRSFALRELRRSGLIRLPDGITGAERAELRERLRTTQLPGTKDGDRHECIIPDARAAERQRQRQIAAGVEGALATLPGRSAAILRGRFFAGLTLGEVAAAVGLSRRRVRQIEQEALELLRRRCPDVADLIAA